MMDYIFSLYRAFMRSKRSPSGADVPAEALKPVRNKN